MLTTLRVERTRAFLLGVFCTLGLALLIGAGTERGETGRYQMVAGTPGAHLYVLDTQTGVVRPAAAPVSTEDTNRAILYYGMPFSQTIDLSTRSRATYRSE